MCEDRYEIGIRGNWPGALAEQLRVPAACLRPVPDGVDDTTAALVEPAGCAHRAVVAAQLRPGQRVCVFGPGTLGLLAVQFIAARGVGVDVVGVQGHTLELARTLGAANAWRAGTEPTDHYDVVIDTSPSPSVGQLALRRAEPGGRVVLVGIADTPSVADLREITLNDLTVVGINSAAAHFDLALAELATGRIRTAPLVRAVVGLDDAGAALTGRVPGAGGPGPKTMVDPRVPPSR
ncbi:hypothetical protein GCM10027614_19350 [Micromonospora vulcania]